VSAIVHLLKVKDALKKSPRGEALNYLAAFELKLEMAHFHVESLPRERGNVPERSHTEAAIFQMKAGLDCVAEAVNQIYQLWIVPKYALSIEQLWGKPGKNLASHNPRLRSWLGRLRRKPWWLDFKDLRDRVAHRGLAIHHFTMITGGPEPSATAHLEANGVRSERELQEDLEHYLASTRACGEEICQILLLDPSWQQA